MKRFIFLVCLFTTPAVAQQQATPNEQAMGTKLMQEIQGGLNCNANLISVQAELAKAQARIKELETKPEEKK
jgi:hypothetical protein